MSLAVRWKRKATLIDVYFWEFMYELGINGFGGYMLIDKYAQYALEMQKEEKGRVKHGITSENSLLFKGADLYKAIVYMGMLPTDIRSAGRKEEISFKISLVEAALAVRKDNYLSMNETTFTFLDSSEKGCINYWLGMFFATLLIQKKYSYEYIIHYSRFLNSSYCKSKPVSSAVTGSKLGRGKTKIEPDLIAIDSEILKYGVFEAKGYQRFNNATMEHAYDQVMSIGYVNGTKVTDNIISFSRLNFCKNTIRYKDPDGKEGINFEPYLAILWQLKPIVELIQELGYESNNDYIVSNTLNDRFSILVNKSLYDLCANYGSDLEQGRLEKEMVYSILRAISQADKARIFDII